jgi:AbrB family looped-hinge helix DNA binding protein
MGISVVTRNYQVTIPRDVREVKGIGIGDKVIFSIEGERVEMMKKEPTEALREAFGLWKGKESGAAYVKRIRAESEKRMRRLGLKRD